jgi:hypothetical protein
VPLEFIVIKNWFIDPGRGARWKQFIVIKKIRFIDPLGVQMLEQFIVIKKIKVQGNVGTIYCYKKLGLSTLCRVYVGTIYCYKKLGLSIFYKPLCLNYLDLIRFFKNREPLFFLFWIFKMLFNLE